MRDHITRDISMCSVCQKIVKGAHQTLRNLIRNFELQDNPYLDSDDLWSGIFAAASFAMCSMYHTTLHDTWPAHIWEGYDT